MGQPSPGRIVPTWRVDAAVYHGGTKRGPVVERMRALVVGALGQGVRWGTVGRWGAEGAGVAVAARVRASRGTKGAVDVGEPQCRWRGSRSAGGDGSQTAKAAVV